jgi:hypothetical protein
VFGRATGFRIAEIIKPSTPHASVDKASDERRSAGSTISATPPGAPRPRRSA